MLFIYSLLLFSCISIITYTILNYLNLQFYLSHVTLSIIFGLLLTKIIHYNYSKETDTINKNIKKNELIVGISPDYAPYAFIKNDIIVGLDIDLLELIAEKLNLQLKFVCLPFQSILISLQLNSIMIGASGLSGNKERKKQMLISTPYFENNLCAISRKEYSYNSLDALKNKKIIINTGYTSETYVNENNLGENSIKLKSITDAIMSLNLKQGDAFITSYASIVELLKTKEAENLFIYMLPNSEGAESVSLFVNKNNPTLLTEINTIIDTLLIDGTLQKLIKKWNLV